MTFLNGTTVEEIESQAVALAALLDANGRRQESPPAPDLLTGMAETKARQKEALTALFCGPASQPRDAFGRFVKATGFDGGARANVPQPPESHERWLVRRLRDRLADVGSRFAS